MWEIGDFPGKSRGITSNILFLRHNTNQDKSYTFVQRLSLYTVESLLDKPGKMGNQLKCHFYTNGFHAQYFSADF